MRRTNSSDLSFSIFLSSLLSSSLPSVFFIYANRHIAPSNARENNSTPSFLFARSSLTGKKWILDLVRRSNRSRPNFLRLFHDIDRKLDSLVYQYRKLSRFSSFSSLVSCIVLSFLTFSSSFQIDPRYSKLLLCPNKACFFWREEEKK